MIHQLPKLVSLLIILYWLGQSRSTIEPQTSSWLPSVCLGSLCWLGNSLSKYSHNVRVNIKVCHFPNTNLLTCLSVSFCIMILNTDAFTVLWFWRRFDHFGSFFLCLMFLPKLLCTYCNKVPDLCDSNSPSKSPKYVFFFCEILFLTDM